MFEAVFCFTGTPVDISAETKTIELLFLRPRIKTAKKGGRLTFI